MDKVKNIAKGGWHPERDKKPSYSTSSSSGSGFKGVDQIKGWVGKGPKNDSYSSSSHQSTPLSSLRDPAEFGPPPKRTDSNPVASTPATTGTRRPPPTPSRSSTLNSRNEAEPSPPPSGPYRVDTTGLNTANLPPPPRRADSGMSASSTLASARQAVSPVQSPPLPNKPKLPPRLPPRSAAPPPSPPPAYTETAQQNTGIGSVSNGSLDRLGAAGVSVPGLNIGRTSSPPSTASASAAGSNTNFSSFQSRFAKLGVSSSSNTQSQPDNPPNPSGSESSGTSWAQKRAALQTASQMQNDPSKVSFNDMRNAASTANNFRERHGEQVATGLRTANGLNQKYGVVNGANEALAPAPAAAAAPVARKKPPPPPPPPKKKALGEQGEVGATASPPPPIPLASKPRP